MGNIVMMTTISYILVFSVVIVAYSLIINNTTFILCIFLHNSFLFFSYSGNNRCNLSGVDLNRQWKLPIKALHPTIFHLKYFMQAQRKLRDVCMYIDLHGHSRKYNVFMYGCDDKKKPRPQVRTFPKMLSMHSAGRKYVCYNDCSFAVKKGRESTARVVVSKEINILNSFTLEATFCGSNYGPLKHCHMNIGHLQEVGSSLCDSILNYFISEGVVKDTLTVPHNVKAVLAFEKIIASEGLGSTNEYSTSYSAGGSGAGGFSSAMYNNNTTNGTTNGIAEGWERSESNSTEPSSSNKAREGGIGERGNEGRSGEKSGSTGEGSDKSGKCLSFCFFGVLYISYLLRIVKVPITLYM